MTGKERHKVTFFCFIQYIILIAYQFFPSLCRITFTSISHQTFIRKILRYLRFFQGNKAFVVFVPSYVHSTSDSADPHEPDTEMLTDEQQWKIRRKTEKNKKEKNSLLHACFVDSHYCHNNIWQPSCRFTELGCAFVWAIFPSNDIGRFIVWGINQFVKLKIRLLHSCLQ